MNFSSAVRWGVIGCGQIAVDKAMPGLLHAAGAQLVAISDPLEPRRALALELAQKHGAAPRAYSDIGELLADADVEAVYIALPTGMHADAVIQAAAAGKAILCEKPLGRSADEVRSIIRATQKANVPLMTAYMSRFSDVFQGAVEQLRAGRIGQITFVAAHFSYPALPPYPPGAPGSWRWTDERGGGPLLDIGIYLAFALREMLGESIVRVGAMQCDTVAPPEAAVRDTIAAWFQTQSGIPGTFVTTFSHNESKITFYGTTGRLEVEKCFLQTPGGRMEVRADDFHFVLDTLKAPDLPHFDNYRREFEHYSAALLAKTPHSPSVEDVLNDALLLDSFAQNGVIDVPSAQQFLEPSQ